MQVLGPKTKFEDLREQCRRRVHCLLAVACLENSLGIRHLFRHEMLAPSSPFLAGQGEQDPGREDAVGTQAFTQLHLFLETLRAAVAIPLQTTEQAAMPIDPPHATMLLIEGHRPGSAATGAEGSPFGGSELLQLLLSGGHPGLPVVPCDQ